MRGVKVVMDRQNDMDFGKIILGLFCGTVTALVGKGGLHDELS